MIQQQTPGFIGSFQRPARTEVGISAQLSAVQLYLVIYISHPFKLGGAIVPSLMDKQDCVRPDPSVRCVCICTVGEFG